MKPCQWRFLIIGTILGLCFPALGSFYLSMQEAHLLRAPFATYSSPLMNCLQLVPVTIGLFAFFIGRRFDQLNALNQSLQERVNNQNSAKILAPSTELLHRERLKKLIDQLPYGAVFIDGNQLTLSSRAERILGYKKNEITTLSDWFSILSPINGEIHKQAYLAARQKGFPTPVLGTITSKLGSLVFLEITRYIDTHGEIWLLSDLTHQLEIQNERNTISEILEKSTDGILILDNHLNIVTQNSASERKSGPLVSNNFSQLIPQNRRTPFEQQVLGNLNHERFWHGQIQLIDSNEEEFPALLRLFAHFDPILQKPFYSALITDLTEIELERYKSIQSAKLASIGELAAGVGHEINNPLAILHMIYEQCVRLVDKQAPLDKIKQQLVKQEAAIDRITKIVDALRVYSRGEGDQFERISVHQGIQDTLNLIEVMFNREGIKIVTTLNAQDDLILGNFGQIQQVMMNLLSNAKDALINSTTKQVSISTHNDGEFLIVSVSDTGQGMDEKTKQKIFQPLFTTKPRGKGTGLGINISQNIIRNHYGELNFTTRVNEGTTFWFKIKTAPYSDQTVAPQCKTIPSSLSLPITNNSTPPVAMVVDDEPEIREILRFMLERVGFTVHEASDGVSGFQLSTATKFDVIICDIQMPKLDGISMYQRLKERPGFDSKFILITGGVQTSRTPQEHLEIISSIDGFLRKPFDDQDLYDTLKSLTLIN